MLKRHKVKKYIVSQLLEMNPNARIPSRKALATRFGYSRATIDQAIDELVAEGVLFTRVGSGTYLRESYRSGMDRISSAVASWGVVLPDLVGDGYPQFVRGIEDYAREHNINIILCNTDSDIEKQHNSLLRLVDSEIQGAIIIPAVGHEGGDSFAPLMERRIPYVFCNRAEPDSTAPLICSNDFYGGYIATKHLLGMGYRRIAYVAPQRYRASIDRYLGYASALMEKGIGLEQQNVLMLTLPTSHPDMRALVEEISLMLRGDSAPDAFFCFNDRTAMSVYHAIHKANKRVSADIGVIGYDDSDLCEAFETPLTSVRYMGYPIGKKAAEILDQEIHGQRLHLNRVFVFQPELAIRKSCMGRSGENE